jgi:hypothetical protein
MIIDAHLVPDHLHPGEETCRWCRGFGLVHCSACSGLGAIVGRRTRTDCPECAGAQVTACDCGDRWRLRWRRAGDRWACLVCGRVAAEATETCGAAPLLYDSGDRWALVYRLACGRPSHAAPGVGV